jgi:hypothetical protein
LSRERTREEKPGEHEVRDKGKQREWKTNQGPMGEKRQETWKRRAGGSPEVTARMHYMHCDRVQIREV